MELVNGYKADWLKGNHSKGLNLRNPSLCSAKTFGVLQARNASIGMPDLTTKSVQHSPQLRNELLLACPAVGVGKTSAPSGVSRPARLSNQLLKSQTAAVGELNVSNKRLPKLTSSLALTSSCLNKQIENSAGLKSSLASFKLRTTATTSLTQQKSSLNRVYGNALDLMATQDNDVMAKRPSIKRHIQEINSGSYSVSSKKPRYNIDWSLVKVDGEEEMVTAEDAVESVADSEDVLVADPVVAQKRRFINTMSASLLRAPNFKSIKDETRQLFVSLCEEISLSDPEFILKVALYSRKDLNIRGASSFLLAFAARHPPCRPFLKKYFNSTINLPSDWIEVAEIYQTFQDAKLNFGALPNALRRVMVEKFPDFDKYQLAKYNKDKKAKPKKKENKKQEERMERHKKSGIAPAEMVPDQDSDDEEEVTLKTFTLKQLIRQLHIKSPVDHVMCLVGKKYPETREEFYKCNLPGEFDESLAGKRMRLPTPETWETQVSSRGNKAEVWQSLIDHKKLPFMAMLRNIRNMLKAGISEKHHQWVIGKLTDEGSIANSKQFPFRFFSAYTVLDALDEDYDKHQEKLVAMAEKLAEADENALTTSRHGMKKTKEQRRSDQKKNEMRKRLKQDLKYDKQLVDRYRKALDTSVELATNYNVPPIPGVTLIFCNVGSSMFCPCTTYKGMGEPRKVVEVGLLLGLMCKHACESSEFILYADGNQYKTVTTDKRGILTNTASLVLYANYCNKGGTTANIPGKVLQDILLERRHVDNILVLSDGLRYDRADGLKMEEFLKAYRHLINPRVLFVSIDLSSKSTGVESGLVSKHPNDVFLAGFSDQLLRYVAEMGDQGQITYVDNIDVKYNLVTEQAADVKCSEKAPASKRQLKSISPPLNKTLTWRVARVFISSTFLDMHGERDILTRFVFPEIRQWARKRLVNVLDVDLRWGVSQHATKESGSLALCLEEVMSADYFIGILGDRVGWMPSVNEIPHGLQYEWMRCLPWPQSATGLEIQLALRTKAPQNCFFFIRDSNFIRTVPAEYKPLFADSPENNIVLAELKDMVRRKGVPASLQSGQVLSQVFDNYPAKWIGLVDDKPMAGGLEKFALHAMRVLKTTITADYPIEEAFCDELQDIKVHQDALVEEGCEKFKGRNGTLMEFHRNYDVFDCGICLIHGDIGVGKTTFMSRISHELSQMEEPTFRHIVCTGYDDMTMVLRRLCMEISSSFHLPYDPAYDYYELIDILSDLLTSVSSLSMLPYIIMLDGLNYLQPDNNSQTCNWLPEIIPKNIVFLLSCATNSTPHRVLGRRKDVRQLELRSLDVLDKSAIVRENLTKYGKQLDESPFNNQMKLLTGKRSASNPLYLMLACEQLRFHGVFEKVTEKIKEIPQTLPKLLDYILSSLEIDFGPELISRLMKLLYCLPTGGLINDIKQMLAVYMSMSANSTLTHALSMFDELAADSIIPALIFTQILHRLNCLLDDYQVTSVLRLTYNSVKEAIKKRYIKSLDVEQQCHLLISAFYLSVIEKTTPAPQFVPYYLDVIHHLKCSCQFAKAKELLSSLTFLHGKCSLSLVNSLNADFRGRVPATAGISAERKWLAVLAELDDYSHFIYKNTHLLLSGPNQLLQLALNEPEASRVCQSARQVVDTLEVNYVDWTTKPDSESKCLATIEPEVVVQCTAISPDGQLLALGGEDCRVHLYSVSDCQEKMTLVGHAHLISDLYFVGGDRLMSASHDCSVSLWDITTGHRLALLNKHTKRVSACVSTKLSLLTAGWDGLLKMWTREGKFKNDVCRVPSPINDMSLHPEEVHAAIACWDSTVKVYNILTNKRMAVGAWDTRVFTKWNSRMLPGGHVLHGHKSSVRNVSYANNGHYISSVSLDGELKLWSASNGTQMGSFEGHSLPVRDLCFSSDGNRLITAAEDCRVKVWSEQLGLCLDKWSADKESVCCLSINSNCTYLAAGSNLGHVRLFEVTDLSSPKYTRQLEENVPVTSLCWTRDNEDVVCATASGSLYKYCPSVHPASGRSPLSLIAAGSRDCSILSVQTSCDWLIAFTTDNGKVTVSSTNGTRQATNVQKHSGSVSSCSFSSNGKRLATGGKDHSIVVWAVESGREVTLTHQATLTQAHLDGITSVCWSDSVDLLASASNDCLVKVWDFTKTTPPTEAKLTLKGHEAALTCVAYRAGCIVSTSMDGELKVWSQKGSEVTSIRCQSGALAACSLGIGMSSTVQEEEGFGTADWAERMEYEDSVEDRKSTKAKMRADVVKHVLVAVGGSNGELQIWNPLRANQVHQYIFTSAALSVCSQSSRVISSHLDKSVKMWNLPMSKEVERGETHVVGQRSDFHQIMCMEQTPDFLFTGSFDGQLSVWSKEGTTPTWLHQIRCSTKAISAIAVHPGPGDLKVSVGCENGGCHVVKVIQDGRQIKLRLVETVDMSQKYQKDIPGLKDRNGCWPIIQIKVWRNTIHFLFGDHLGLAGGEIKCQNFSAIDLDYKLNHSFGLKLAVDNLKEAFPADVISHMRLSDDLVTCHRVCGSRHWLGTDKGVVAMADDSLPISQAKRHSGRVTCLEVIGDMLISGALDGTVKLWRVDYFGRLKLVAKFTSSSPILSMACELMSQHGKRKTVVVYIGDKLGEVHRLDFHIHQ